MKIKNITVREFDKLKEAKKMKYVFMLDMFQMEQKSIFIKIKKNWVEVKPKQIDLWNLPFNDIINFKKVLKEKNQERVISFLLKNFYDISKTDNVSIFSLKSLQWVFVEFEKIAKAEQQLNEEPSVVEKNAGVGELDKFEEYTTIDFLAKGDITKTKEILKIPYKEVFMKLLLEKTTNKIKQNIYDSRKD